MLLLETLVCRLRRSKGSGVLGGGCSDDDIRLSACDIGMGDRIRCSLKILSFTIELLRVIGRGTVVISLTVVVALHEDGSTVMLVLLFGNNAGVVGGVRALLVLPSIAEGGGACGVW